MFKQMLIADADNSTVTIPTEWFGMQVVVLAYPVSTSQSKGKKPLAWLSGKSRIDNPVRIGKGFRKVSRDEIYERKGTR